MRIYVLLVALSASPLPQPFPKTNDKDVMEGVALGLTIIGLATLVPGSRSAASKMASGVPLGFKASVAGLKNTRVVPIPPPVTGVRPILAELPLVRHLHAARPPTGGLLSNIRQGPAVPGQPKGVLSGLGTEGIVPVNDDILKQLTTGPARPDSGLRQLTGGPARPGTQSQPNHAIVDSAPLSAIPSTPLVSSESRIIVRPQHLAIGNVAPQSDPLISKVHLPKDQLLPRPRVFSLPENGFTTLDPSKSKMIPWEKPLEFGRGTSQSETLLSKAHIPNNQLLGQPQGLLTPGKNLVPSEAQMIARPQPLVISNAAPQPQIVMSNMHLSKDQFLPRPQVFSLPENGMKTLDPAKSKMIPWQQPLVFGKAALNREILTPSNLLTTIDNDAPAINAAPQSSVFFKNILRPLFKKSNNEVGASAISGPPKSELSQIPIPNSPTGDIPQLGPSVATNFQPRPNIPVMPIPVFRPDIIAPTRPIFQQNVAGNAQSGSLNVLAPIARSGARHFRKIKM